LIMICGDVFRVGLAQEFVKLEVFYDNLNYLQYSEKQSMTVSRLLD